MSTSLRRCILPLATLALVTACAEGPVGPADAPDLSHFPTAGPLGPTGPSFATIGPVGFEDATVIDFEVAPNEEIGNLYAEEGVEIMTGLWGGYYVNTGTGVGPSQSACGLGEGSIRFETEVTRAGFYILTFDAKKFAVSAYNTTVSAYSNGSLVDSESFETSLGALFAGVTFDGPFDQLVIVVENNVSGIFCIDNLMFGSGGEVTLEVTLDIMPGSETNPINPRSRGKIPVAVLSATDFDAPAEVDASSLTFGATGDETSLDLRGGKNAVPNCGVEDVNGDGLADLVCHFDNGTANLAGTEEGTLKGLTKVGILKGFTIDETPLIGTDVVTIVGA